MALSMISQLLAIITAIALYWIIFIIWCKKTGEPESDERTERIAGNAAQNTITVLMFALAIIGWGDILGSFELGTPALVILLFFVLMTSIIAFQRYYNSKGMQVIQ